MMGQQVKVGWKQRGLSGWSRDWTGWKKCGLVMLELWDWGKGKQRDPAVRTEGLGKREAVWPFG